MYTVVELPLKTNLLVNIHLSIHVRRLKKCLVYNDMPTCQITGLVHVNNKSWQVFLTAGSLFQWVDNKHKAGLVIILNPSFILCWECLHCAAFNFQVIFPSKPNHRAWLIKSHLSKYSYCFRLRFTRVLSLFVSSQRDLPKLLKESILIVYKCVSEIYLTLSDYSQQ